MPMLSQYCTHLRGTLRRSYVMHFCFVLSQTTNGFPVAGALHVEGGSGGVTLLRVGGGVLVLKKQLLGCKTKQSQTHNISTMNEDV